MVSDTSDQPPRATLLAARAQAGMLLERLSVDRRLSEQRLSVTGRTDLMKEQTGASALERAIESTGQMIDRMDGLLADLNGDAASLNGSGVHSTNGVRLNSKQTRSPAMRAIAAT